MQSYALLLECALRRGKLRFIAEAALAAVEARLAGTAFMVRAAFAVLAERTLIAVVLAIRVVAFLTVRTLLAIVLAIRTVAFLTVRALLAVVLAIRTDSPSLRNGASPSLLRRTNVAFLERTLLAGRLTVGALQLLSADFSVLTGASSVFSALSYAF
ncbi:MAG: hypothetical protein ACLT2F_00925 [Butyricicoccus sp.]